MKKNCNKSKSSKKTTESGAAAVSPCPAPLNKIPICCDYYKACTSSEAGWIGEGREEEGNLGKALEVGETPQGAERKEVLAAAPDAHAEDGRAALEEEAEDNAQGALGQPPNATTLRCRRVPKKHLKPCVRRSQVNIPLPGKPPEQFGGKRPCRKQKPKPCRRRKRCVKKSQPCGDEEDEEGLCECERDPNDLYGVGGRGFGPDGNDEDEEGEDGWDGWDGLGGKRPCKKRKKKPKKPPCRAANAAFAEDNKAIFPSLPLPNLGQKPPLQKFPPAEDPSKPEGRRGPCKKRKAKPCRKRGGSSECSTSSEEEEEEENGTPD